MRKHILTAFAVLSFLVLAPSAAQAAIVTANAGAGAAGHMLLWSLSYDTNTKDVTLNVTHTRFDGSPAIGDPQVATIVLIRPNGQEQVYDLLTLVNPVDGQPNVLNDGPLVFSPPGGLRVSSNRAQLIEFRTEYVPPIGA